MYYYVVCININITFNKNIAINKYYYCYNNNINNNNNSYNYIQNRNICTGGLLDLTVRVQTIATLLAVLILFHVL